MSNIQNGLMGFGPQYSKDISFTARMRFHQSWYRSRVLKVPYGTGPTSRSSTHFGNMLTRADGERGYNFLNPRIFEVAQRRLTDKRGMVEPFRLLCNMLSSQPMCFNLFGPLVNDRELATSLMRALFPDDIQQVTHVILEYAPEPSKDYLNDRTAFDAFVAYTNPSGERGFLGIETKLTEAFSARVYRSEFYDRWLDYPSAPWPASSVPELQAKQVNQLWRDHLLAYAMKVSPSSNYSTGRFILVYHPMDAKCVEALNVYQALLRPEDASFAAIPLDRLIALWSAAVISAADQLWIRRFLTRYLDLEASEAEYLTKKVG
jgi:hypothetical protein